MSDGATRKCPRWVAMTGSEQGQDDGECSNQVSAADVFCKDCQMVAVKVQMSCPRFGQVAAALVLVRSPRVPASLYPRARCCRRDGAAQIEMNPRQIRNPNCYDGTLPGMWEIKLSRFSDRGRRPQDTSCRATEETDFLPQRCGQRRSMQNGICVSWAPTSRDQWPTIEAARSAQSLPMGVARSGSGCLSQANRLRSTLEGACRHAPGKVATRY